MKLLLAALLFGMLAFGVLAFLWVTPTSVSSAGSPVEMTHPADGDHGDHVHCPPCGMDMPSDSPKHEVEGLTFAFCSERCQEVVSADPEAFAAQAIARSADGE